MTAAQGPAVAAGSQDAVDQERIARVGLCRVSEPMDQVVGDLVRRVGAARAWDAVRANAGGRYDRFAPRVADADVDRTREVADRLGIRIVVPGDADWPEGLDDLEAPPLCLWVRGPASLTGARQRGASIVGARLSTMYGDAVARELAHDLAVRGFTIVSGGAFGIDAAAHRGALAGEGTTVALMAGGVDRLYPVAHADLLQEVMRAGAVVSECAPGTAPQRHRFLARNRLIAALTPGTVVVEAGIRSGSLNTARNAERIHRVVAAVPGPVTSISSVGTNELIRQGIATLVTDAAEVVELLGAMGEELPSRREAPQSAADTLPDTARGVLDALPVRRTATVDQLTRSAGLAVPDILSALGLLELRGLAARSPGGWRRAG